MSLKSFFAKTFERLFGQEPVTTPQKKRAPSKKNDYARKNGHWIKRQLKDYDGKSMVVVKVPAGMPMQCAQSSVNSHVTMRFGKGKLTTRRFSSARTIHVRPVAA